MYYKKHLEGISQKNLKSVVLIYGEELYILERIVNEIRNRYVDIAFSDFNYVKLDGSETELISLMDQCEQMPFMSEKKVLIVEDLTLFEKSMDNEEKFYKYLENTNKASLLVLILKKNKVDKRKKIYKTIKKVGQIIELPKLKDAELSRWIRNYLEQRDKAIAAGELNYIVEMLGYSDKNSLKTLYDVKNELDKLLNYLGENHYIKREDIDKSFVKSLQNNIFELIDLTTSKQKGLAELLFQDMILSNEPVNLIIYMITKQYRNLLFAKALTIKGYNQNDLATKLGIHPFVASKLMKQLSKFTTKQLKRNYRLCLNADRKIKTGELDAKIAVEILIANL